MSGASSHIHLSETSGHLMAIELTTVRHVALDAFFYTMTKAQLDALKINSDPTTQAYFDAFVASLKSLGWQQYPASTYSNYSKEQPQSPFQAALGAFVHFANEAMPFLNLSEDSFESYIPEISKALQTAPKETIDMLDDWWQASKVSAAARVFMMGPVFELMMAPATILGHFKLDMQASSWRDLLDPNAATKLEISPIPMVLNLSVYKKISGKLKRELKDDLLKRIKTAPLDMSVGNGVST